MITQNQLDLLIAAYPILHQLPAALQKQICQHCRPLGATGGEILFDVGDICQNFVFVCRGDIRVMRPLPAGKELLLYEVQVGEICLMTVSCLLSEEDYVVRGTAGQDLCGFFLARPVFEEWLIASPPFRRFVFKNFNIRIENLVKIIEEVGYGPLNARLAKLLLQRRERVIKTTHQQLANDLGTAREVVSRLLRQFAEEEIVALSRGLIRIIDVDKLAVIGGGLRDPGH